MEKSYAFRSVEGLKVALIIFLVLDLVLSVLSAGSSWMTIALLQRPYTVEEGELNDLRDGAIGILQLGVYIVSAIVVCVWAAIRLYWQNYFPVLHDDQYAGGSDVSLADAPCQLRPQSMPNEAQLSPVASAGYPQWKNRINLLVQLNIR